MRFSFEIHWASLWRGFLFSLVLGFIVLAVPGPRPDTSSESFKALGISRDYLFNFVAWQTAAVWDKALIGSLAPQRYMTEAERTAFLREYLALIDELARLEDAVKALYADPTITDPEAASADLRAARDWLRAVQGQRQALAEAIVQAQIAEVLAAQGFGSGGQVLPPVAIRFTQPPMILITSPRDRIERSGSYPLTHGLPIDAQQRLEDSLEAELDVASLVVPLGGLALYPAMMQEIGWPPAVFEIAAHEWAHHYLTFYPLGLNYGRTPALYTMNETTANILGKEVAWLVLSRYYPDFAPPPPDYSTPLAPAASRVAGRGPSGGRPPFNFGREMRITRLVVDDLLSEGQIETAEAYMEQRRAHFVQNGHLVRRLNQAYFAFYGAYADAGGATGGDPIGPAIRELRGLSPSLHAFMVTMRGITTEQQLYTALEEARLRAGASAEAPPP